MTDPNVLRYRWFAPEDTERFMRQSLYGFQSIYEHLRTTRAYLQRLENLASARWTLTDLAELAEEDRELDGVWIDLIEPDDDDPAAARFHHFFDEMTRAVEQRAEDATAGAGRHERIAVLEQHQDGLRLRLRTEPTQDLLVVPPNTYIVQKQMEALRTLQNQPHPAHFPLLQLVQPIERTQWPVILPSAPRRWFELDDATRPGTDQQRRFVSKAMATPDFAILEGPPGAGKTTTIVELICQAVAQGQRVLVCASTHVAVDNVLERLDASDHPLRDEIVALRIGQRARVAPRIRHLQLEERAATERSRLQRHLSQLEDPTLAQERMRQVLEDDEQDRVEQLILGAANVVCGTTIGILQHPDIKQQRREGQQPPLFDLLILDEASKTTLQEFLVPAVLARRWILSGDIRQLSPHVDTGEVEAALEPAAQKVPAAATAGADFFRLERDRLRTLILHDHDPVWTDLYGTKAQELGMVVVDGPVDELPAGLVVWPEDHPLPKVGADTLVRAPGPDPQALRLWASELAWRLSTRFQLRLSRDAADRSVGESLQRLLPPEQHVAGLGRDIEPAVERIERLVLPSILEGLQSGLGLHHERALRTVLTDGLPSDALERRHERLTFQFRMHPEISAFPREAFYDGDALRDPDGLEARRTWDYRRFATRTMWLDVRHNGSGGSGRASPTEGARIIRELETFRRWVEEHPDQRSWSIAVLCFYRDQERELRRQLRKLTGQPTATRSFTLAGRTTRIDLDLCTVDGIQGQEADLTFLSIAAPRTTSFTRSANRVNVALTRARYQSVIVGDRNSLRRGAPSPLRTLARNVPADITWEGEHG